MALPPTNMQPQQGQPPAPAQQQPDPARYTDEADSEVSPEEQEQYSKFEQNYLKLIYTQQGEVNPAILESLRAAQGQQVNTQGDAVPPHLAALAATTVTIVQKLDDSAREAGKPLTDDVLQEGGAAVMEELADIAEAAGIYDYSEDEMAGALTVAFDMYRDKAMADGRIDQETAQRNWDEMLASQDVATEEQQRGAGLLPVGG